MAWLAVQAIEVTEGQLIRINDSVRVEQVVNSDGAAVWYGTVNEIIIYNGTVEVTVTNGDGADINVDIDCVEVNETQGW